LKHISGLDPGLFQDLSIQGLHPGFLSHDHGFLFFLLFTEARQILLTDFLNKILLVTKFILPDADFTKLFYVI
jgi:hypothetical protein